MTYYEKCLQNELKDDEIKKKFKIKCYGCSFTIIFTKYKKYVAVFKMNESGYALAKDIGKEIIYGKNVVFITNISEFIKKYPNSKNKWKRMKDVHERLQVKKYYIELRKQTRLDTYHAIRRLKKACQGQQGFSVAIDLLTTRKFRSSFRESLNNQIRDWLNNKNPEHVSPLSWKQIQCLYKHLRIRY